MKRPPKAYPSEVLVKVALRDDLALSESGRIRRELRQIRGHSTGLDSGSAISLRYRRPRAEAQIYRQAANIVGNGGTVETTVIWELRLKFTRYPEVKAYAEMVRTIEWPWKVLGTSSTGLSGQHAGMLVRFLGQPSASDLAHVLNAARAYT